MTQPQLPGFGTPGYSDYTPAHHPASIKADCRAAANEKAHKHGGLVAEVEGYYKRLPAGSTADHVADLMEDDGKRVVLNTIRRCAFDLDEQGDLIAIGIGESRYGNPQTLYVHKDFRHAHRAAIEAHQAQEAAKKAGEDLK